jgi:transcriptional regulator with XRE-family HTH domain
MGGLVSIGSQIAERRKELKLTQTELSRKAGISRAALDALENGRARIGFLEALQALAVLGLELTLQHAQSQRPHGVGSPRLHGERHARRAEGHSGAPARGARYATTLRTYDSKLKAWRVNFINPAADETSAQLIARRSGTGIEMEGTLSGGTPVRWRYQAITPTSFHYNAEKQSNDGRFWRLYLELFGKRSRS